MELYENERIDYVNDKLSLIQKTDGLTFGTDALLLAGYISGGYRVGVELGGGTGIISMLLRTREKVGRAYAVEVQEEYAELIKRNTEFNGITELIPVQADVREYKCPSYIGSTVALNSKNIHNSHPAHHTSARLFLPESAETQIIHP